MRIAKIRGGFKRCIPALLAMTVLICNFPLQIKNTSAAEADENLYIPRAEDTLLNGAWTESISTTDLTDGGIKLDWQGTNDEIVNAVAKAFPLDGLTLKLNNLTINDSDWCNLAFVITDRGDWSVQMKNNQSLTLVLNTLEGKLQAVLRQGFDANWEATVETQMSVIENEALKYAAISGKPFEISLHKESGSYRVDIDVNGNVLQGWIPEGYFKYVSDPNNVIISYSPSGVPGNENALWQKMSVEVKGIGPRFNWPENERRIIPQKDNMHSASNNWGDKFAMEALDNGLKLKWKNGAQDMRAAANTALDMDGLAIEFNDYNYRLMPASGEQAAYPAFVIGSSPEPATWDSYPDLVNNPIGNLTVSFGENSLVAKAKTESCTIISSTELHKSRLFGKPVRIILKDAGDGSYNVEINVGSWKGTGKITKAVMDDANGINNPSSVYVSATIAAPGNDFPKNATIIYTVNGIYNDSSDWDLAEVEDAINNAADSVQLADGSPIREARRLYEAGTKSERAQVTNYDKLTAAEAEYARLTAEADKWLIPMNKASGMLSSNTGSQDIQNAVNNGWKNWMVLTELAGGAGLRYHFTGAPTDVREGFAKPVNLDGLTLQMDNLYGNGSFALFFGEVAGWGPDSGSSKLTLVFNSKDGTVTDKDGNVIIGSELLKYENIKQKRFSISFEMNEDGSSFTLKLTVNGNTVSGTVGQEIISLENTTKTYFALTAYGENQSFDIDFLGVGLEDQVQEVIDLIDAIGMVKIDSDVAINAAQTAYDKLSDARKEQVINHKTLENAVYYWYSLDYDSMITDTEDAINEIGVVNELSGSAIRKAEKLYDRLIDEQKAKVANADVFAKAKNKYEKLINPLLSFEQSMYDPALKTLRLETSGAEWWGDARRIERPKTGGARLIWKNAVRNMRDGTSDTYNLDGLYFQISDITRDEGKDGAQLSIQIGTADNDYAGFYGDSLALVLDTVSGEVRAYPGGGTIIRSEALRHSAIEGKTLMFEINLTDDGLYSLTVRKDGTALKGIITASAFEYAKVGALTDTEEVLVAITPWGEDGTATASFAATLLSIQSTGGYAFEQWIDLVFAIDALPEKADRGNTDNILELYGRYCKLSRNLKERVTNYGKLAGLMNQIYEMELVDYSYLDNWLNEDGTFQVQTGDSQPVTLFAIIMILSLAVLILTAKHKGRAG